MSKGGGKGFLREIHEPGAQERMYGAMSRDRAELPAWMSDRSQLPKTPPGREPPEDHGHLKGSAPVECTNGHKLRIVTRNGRLNAIAMYRPQDGWWEYVDASEPFCPECGGEIK